MRKPGYEQEAKKGAWTDEEDRKLVYHIRTYGQGCWRTLPKAAGLSRCGKSCRLRWMNYLRPNIKRGKFDEDEEDLVIKLHALLGNRWSLIAGRLPGRTDNEVKNYWNSYLKRKLSALGIDPNNHRMSQTIHYSQNHNMSGSVGTSYDSINEEFNPIKTHAYPIDQTYNVTSLLEDNTSGSINLIPDLTYGSNSSFIGQSYISDCEIIEANESESDESRTLLLFT